MKTKTALTTREKILILLEKNGPQSPGELIGELKLGRAIIQRHLKQLLAEGRIQKIGVAPRVTYQLKNDWGPDKRALYPNAQDKSCVFIANLPPRANLVVGDYTYYRDEQNRRNVEQFWQQLKVLAPERKWLVEIGNYCGLAAEVELILTETTMTKSVYPWRKLMASEVDQPLLSSETTLKIKIGHDVQIGAGAKILAGAEIETGARILPEAVVSKKVPAFAIVAGNPGRVIGFRFDQKRRLKVLASKWWEKDGKDVFAELEAAGE